MANKTLIAHPSYPIDDPIFDVVNASVYLCTPVPTLRQYTAERRITSYKPGKKVLYRKSDLDAFVLVSRRASIEQLNQELEQRRQELNGLNTGGAVKGRGARS